MIGCRYAFLGLDRVHEAELRLIPQRLRDKAHFRDGRHVEMRDSASEQGADQIGRRIRFDRIERAPRKLLGKEAGGPGRSLGSNKRYRSCRFEGGRYPQRAMMLVQLKGPPG